MIEFIISMMVGSGIVFSILSIKEIREEQKFTKAQLKKNSKTIHHSKYKNSKRR